MLMSIVGSNDTIRSTMHRVRAPPSVVAKDGLLPPRYSMPYVSFPRTRQRDKTDLVQCLQFCAPVFVSTLSFYSPFIGDYRTGL